VWNRKTGELEVEHVYGDGLVRWAYETSLGRKITDHLLSQPWLSRIYGYYQSSPLSVTQIEHFISEFKIPIDDFQGAPYASFNDFFIRKFKPGKRPFVENSARMAAFAEGRYLGYAQVPAAQTLPVKGYHLSVRALLGDGPDVAVFQSGPVLIARLNPTDYHRFHFPDGGKILRTYSISGSLQSVNPIALRHHEEILIQNERQISILETESFGKIAYIEVGAMGVGKIIQSHPVDQVFRRGDEKGYFLFGGSTVIIVGQSGLWKPDADLLKHTALGQETRIQLGDAVGSLMSD
jgi:phosphatidylserine decarboxylase